MTRRLWKFCFLLVTVLSLGFGQARADDDPWAAYRFLIGEWVGEGGGEPGKGSGSFSLAEDLQGKVLVRRNHAELAPSGGRPGGVHDDLMIIYREQDKTTRAMYFDNEGHIIQYTVTPSDDGRKLTFVSATAPGTPRFQLTYTKRKEDTVAFTFAIAPPGKPDAFKTYIEGQVRRKKGTPGRS